MPPAWRSSGSADATAPNASAPAPAKASASAVERSWEVVGINRLACVGAAQRHVDVAPCLVTPDLELDLLARGRHADDARQRTRSNDGFAVDLGHDVAGLQARLRRRTVGRHVGDQRTVGP